MAQAIPQQHPAVVLRSHYVHLRALLAVAMIAVVGLSGAVVILATNSDTRDIAPGPATQAITSGPAGIRYDGGPEEGTRGALSSTASRSLPAGMRFDGGPEEEAVAQARPPPARAPRRASGTTVARRRAGARGGSAHPSRRPSGGTGGPGS